MMKRRLAAVLAVTVLGAAMFVTAAQAAEAGAQTVAEESPEEAVPEIRYDDFPHIDGSLACVPLIEELAMKLTGCSEAQAEEVLDDFSNTNPCYLLLAAGERDLVLAYEPAQDTIDKLKEYPALDMTPVGRDGLVFIVNKDNPVESLTTQQVIDIYTGKITNWSQVGGNDEEIAAFRRPETSGSQTLMRKLVIGDLEMVDEKLELVESMEGMIQKLKDYDGTASAIGYSVYYYASVMMGQPNLKFLQIDGVTPGNDTIGEGSYPLINDFYCVTRQDSPENALLIRDWLVSEQGQEFVEDCGYVAVGAQQK